MMTCSAMVIGDVTDDVRSDDDVFAMVYVPTVEQIFDVYCATAMNNGRSVGCVIRTTTVVVGSTLNDNRCFDSSYGTFEVGLIVTSTTVNGDDDLLKVTVFVVGPAAR